MKLNLCVGPTDHDIFKADFATALANVAKLRDRLEVTGDGWSSEGVLFKGKSDADVKLRVRHSLFEVSDLCLSLNLANEAV